MAEETGTATIGHHLVNGMATAEEDTPENGIVVADGCPVGGGHCNIIGEKERGAVGKAGYIMTFPMEGFSRVDAIAESLQFF